MTATGATLTSADPEPPEGTVVRDDCGVLWSHDGPQHHPACWSQLDTETHDPETWAKIAGNYGPVTVLKWGQTAASVQPHRPWGVLTDQELAQRMAGIINPTGTLDDAEARARNVISLVRANTTCIGDMNRGCY